MAAAKTSLVLFLFALIAISSNLQMASAAGVQCATDLSLNLNVLNGCTSDTQCVDLCNKECMAKFNVNASASACVLGLLQLLIKSCSCCCASI
ncbi:hypothetical protein MKW98_011799 [Papaver atlanticum]|uniref:Uncharacterized protein n=1 Tax=Papaver atlanticum TaxID=357466 RepID=A0AAD4SPJ4_9MAGN|nr:hypothetical protein MKW98_011799 [Papaver atlanticum]